MKWKGGGKEAVKHTDLDAALRHLLAYTDEPHRFTPAETEHLITAYNPETGTTARKQTGSFYTPRDIVTYMIDESLLAYLKNSIMVNSYEVEGGG